MSYDSWKTGEIVSAADQYAETVLDNLTPEQMQMRHAEIFEDEGPVPIEEVERDLYEYFRERYINGEE